MGFEVLMVMVMKSSTFWGVMPCSQLKVNSRFRGKCHLDLLGLRESQMRNQHEAVSEADFLLDSCLANLSHLKVEMTCSAEMSVDVHWTTWPYIQRIELLIFSHDRVIIDGI
jgi:hypothetical protein